MMIKKRYFSLLTFLLLSVLTLHAQTEEEDITEEKDTLVTDSLWTDSLETLKEQKADSLPWPENVRARIDELVKSDMFQTSQLGMMIWDLDADSCIYAHGERQLLRPASTMKTITAIVALDRLGGSYQFKTELCYTGRIDSCTLVGDVYCVGGFDPRFNSDDMRAFAEALRRMGVDTIRGNIYSDKSMKDSELLGEGWCWDDDNPTLSPLLISRKDEFMSRFFDALRQDGIYLQGAIGEKRKPEDAHCIITRFHTIDQILMRMLKESDNLYAESMFYQIAASTGNRPATAKSARSIIRQLVSKVGLKPMGYYFADGSGLSLYNYVSAELEVRLLRYAYQNENIYHHLLPALPIAGKDGTLRSRMRKTFTRGNVYAKTGTVTGVSSLCGYLTASNGHRIAFSIINQGLRHNSNGRRFQDQVCSILCRLH
jgi:D-alanyl-D-alanine carboxypeptidase/D-alanyl-D-alanine-endopeptidase (penicillin-binding protein 4)